MTCVEGWKRRKPEPYQQRQLHVVVVAVVLDLLYGSVVAVLVAFRPIAANPFDGPVKLLGVGGRCVQVVEVLGDELISNSGGREDGGSGAASSK